MIRAYIPRFRLIEVTGASKNYYVYVLEVSYGGKVGIVEKRYSSFHKLNKELQKQFITGHFPPKKLRNTTTKVLELRRNCLENWLQNIIQINPLPSIVTQFLQISNYEKNNETDDELSTGGTEHQPILVYAKDAFLHQPRESLYSYDGSSSLQNTAVKGALTAFYNPHFKIP